MADRAALASRRRDVGEIPDPAGLALYVHWPFCLSKCPYCDFNSHVRDGIDQARWRAALVRELEHFASETKWLKIGTIFFGGGTPSLMPPATAAAIIDAADRLWGLGDDVEITLEANPTSVEANSFKDFQAAGVNRASIGVQSLDDRALAFLGRRHSAQEARKAIAEAKRNFSRTSFDLIYALPGQTPADWRRELAAALEMADEHLSLYQLSIEKGTPFHAAWRRGALETPEPDAEAALYEETQSVLERAGMPAYEISNHAAPGQECRHNMVYWLGGDYVGIGPGAHGRRAAGAGAVATEQTPSPEAWLASVERDGHGTRVRRDVEPADRLEEVLMMGLRLAAGISRPTFARLTGGSPEQRLDADRLARLLAGGFLVLDQAGLRATADGRLRLDAVLAALIG